MGRGWFARAGGPGKWDVRLRHVPGTVVAGWGLGLLVLCIAFGAIGLGGHGSSGVLFLGLFAGLCMVSWGICRGVDGFGPRGG